MPPKLSKLACYSSKNIPNDWFVGHYIHFFEVKGITYLENQAFDARMKREFSKWPRENSK